MATLLSNLVNQLLGVVSERQPNVSRLANLASGVRSLGSIAGDFRQNGWSLKGSDLSRAFFGG